MNKHPLQGRPLTDDHKQNISWSLQEKPKSRSHKKAISLALKGRQKTLEHKKAIANTMTGKSYPPIPCVFRGTRWPSITLAAKSNGLKRNQVIQELYDDRIANSYFYHHYPQHKKNDK